MHHSQLEQASSVASGRSFDALLDAYGRWETLRDAAAKLPIAREELARRQFELSRIEADIADAEERLNALQSFSLTSILESIGGQKQRKLDEVRDVLTALDGTIRAAQRSVDEIAEQVRELEQSIHDLDGAEVEFRVSCEAEVERRIAAGGTEAQRLTEIAERVAGLRTSSRAVRKAEESGRQLLRHLESLDRSVRNARGNRRMSTALAGPVGGIIKNAVASIAPHSATRYVADGLKRFCAELGELPLGDHPDDADLIRVRAELDAFRERLTTDHSGIMGWDQIATLAAETDVQKAASCLKSFLVDVEREVADLESQRLAILFPQVPAVDEQRFDETDPAT